MFISHGRLQHLLFFNSLPRMQILVFFEFVFLMSALFRCVDRMFILCEYLCLFSMPIRVLLKFVITLPAMH